MLNLTKIHMRLSSELRKSLGQLSSDQVDFRLSRQTLGSLVDVAEKMRIINRETSRAFTRLFYDTYT